MSTLEINRGLLLLRFMMKSPLKSISEIRIYKYA